MQEYYLRVEAVNLDYSVYDTHDISTIRGGSFMLHNAFEGMEQEKDRLSLPCTNFIDRGSAASVGLFSFQTDENDIKSAIIDPLLNRILQDVKSFATVVWSVYPVKERESFTTILQRLLADCRWKQYQQATLVLPSESEKDKEHPCPFDGVRPAAVPDRVGDEERLISRAVDIRRTEGRILRNRIYKDLLKEKVSDLPDDPDNWIFTKNFETLSRRKEAGKLDGKIAFIYLDGNRFGKIRDEKCRDADLYGEFQKKIQKDLRNAALRAVLDFALKPENKPFRTVDEKVRLETLLWGGDDIEWIVPAWEALNVLEKFFETTKVADVFNGVKLTHSGGVVLCNHKLPILQIRRYARELCALAKDSIPKGAIDEIGPEANRFAFLNIVSIDYMTGDMQEFIKSYYRPASVKDFIIPADSIKDLKKYLPVLKKHFPSNKLYQLLGALRNKQYDEVNEIFEKVIKSLSGSQLQAVVSTYDKLIENEKNNWFMVTELMHYVE